MAKETMKVLWVVKFGDSPVTINVEDFNPDIHEPFDGEVSPAVAAPAPAPDVEDDAGDDEVVKNEGPRPHPRVPIAELGEAIVDATPEELQAWLDTDPRVGARVVYKAALDAFEN